jgi:hypothetical protein
LINIRRLFFKSRNILRLILFFILLKFNFIFYISDILSCFIFADTFNFNFFVHILMKILLIFFKLLLVIKILFFKLFFLIYPLLISYLMNLEIFVIYLNLFLFIIWIYKIIEARYSDHWWISYTSICSCNLYYFISFILV